MMRFIFVALQLMLFKKSMDKTQSSIHQLENVFIHLKKLMLFFIGIFCSALFAIFSLIVAVVDIGLQLDKSGGISMSGLMWSSLIFAGISVFFALVSASYLSLKRKKERASIQQDSSVPSVEWVDIANKLLQAFLDSPKKEKSEHRKSDQEA